MQKVVTIKLLKNSIYTKKIEYKFDKQIVKF